MTTPGILQETHTLPKLDIRRTVPLKQNITEMRSLSVQVVRRQNDCLVPKPRILFSWFLLKVPGETLPWPFPASRSSHSLAYSHITATSSSHVHHCLPHTRAPETRLCQPEQSKGTAHSSSSLDPIGEAPLPTWVHKPRVRVSNATLSITAKEPAAVLRFVKPDSWMSERILPLRKKGSRGDML